MKKGTKPDFMLQFMIAISLLGLLTTLLITIYPPTARLDFFFRKPLIGSVFVLVCIGGGTAAIFPRTCSTSFTSHIPISHSDPNVKNKSAPVSKGHHPGCGKFSAHTIQFRGVSYCAACMGLTVGAALAVATTVPYFFLGLKIEQFSLSAALIGHLGPALGFAQFRFKGWARLAVNTLFVLGSAWVLTGIDQNAGSLFVDLYVIGLIMLWILTRILISQWDHSRICISCGVSCGS